jgi:Glycosyl transferase family 2
MAQMKLSVVMITRNEAHRIERCLRSVDFADEWIVLDSGSNDATVSIAREFGATVHVRTDWAGFGPQKNRALALAHGDWVLSLDADELVTAPLAAAIRAVADGDAGTGASACAGYWLARRSSFCGQVIRFGDWGGDRVLRLFRRDSGRFSQDIVHERVDVPAPHGQLAGVLLHDSVESMADGRDKMLRYARLGAIKLRQRRAAEAGPGRAPGTPSVFSAPLAAVRGGWTFARGLILRGGFLDGMAGLRIAGLNAQGTYLRYRWAADPAQTLALDERYTAQPTAARANLKE